MEYVITAGIIAAVVILILICILSTWRKVPADKAAIVTGLGKAKVITGGGGAQEWFNMMLADENQDIWLQSALYSPDMVEDAVDMALDILNGNAPEDPVKIIPTTILDRDTVESHLDENSPY